MPASTLTRWGLGVSGALLCGTAIWLLAVVPFAVWAIALAVGLLVFGLFNLVSGLRSPSLAWANKLALLGQLTAMIAMYIVITRALVVGYGTDTIVGTYLGVLKAVQLQSPYAFSIKPLMDQLGFSPSFYTPGVNGSFDFHLAYPSLSFLALVPFYLGGLHDIRDSIFIFHLASVLIVFALAPSRLKTISLAPFGLFTYLIAYSWTDSVWAFFIVLTALFWYKKPRLSWVSLGLAIAVKQVAVAIVPFLLIREWHEHPTARARTLATTLGAMSIAFFLPNLPFILASPSAWWTDIVAPYLPNSAAQVPGGIGLSNILLDLGVALPSTFYLILMIGTSGLLMFAYARHYRGLNSVVFAFPIIMFFFYYRSFPNYMIYWAFPVVLDICRLGGPNIRAFFAFNVGRITWRPNVQSFYKPLRQRLTPSLVLLMVLTTAFAGVSGAYISQVATPKTQILINSSADPDSIGSATQINVTVSNMMNAAVYPNFFVKFSPLPYYWTYNGNGLLQSGSTRSYLIAAPDAYSAVPAGDSYHVIVYDNLTNQLLGESAGTKANIPTPVVANPGLKWWILDQTFGKKTPFDWKVTFNNINPKNSEVTPLGVNGTSGLTFTINNTAVPGVMAQIVMSQQLIFNSTRLQIALNQTISTNLATKTMMFASLTDGSNTLYYIFSNAARQETTSSFATNTTVIVPVTGTQWANISLNPQTAWNTLNWGTPQRVTFTITVQTTVPGVYVASLNEIAPA